MSESPMSPASTGRDGWSDADLERIAQRVAEIIQGNPQTLTSPICSRSDAMRLTGCGSQMSFSRWCEKWGVKPTGRGRYSIRTIELALARESGFAHTPASIVRRRNSLPPPAAASCRPAAGQQAQNLQPSRAAVELSQQ